VIAVNVRRVAEVRRLIAGIGRTLMTVGALILLFVIYQLWGTGIFTARAQAQLKDKFQQELKQYNADNPLVAPVPTTTTHGHASRHVAPTTIAHSGVRPAPSTPAEGDVEGWITIPRIHLHMAFVEGTSRDDLKKGPGHYPGTPIPGTIGNAAIAGHRTTYLHPFWAVDDLVPGDDIIVQTLAGTFDYQMSEPHLIVKPTDLSVVNNTRDAELTLTSCNPKGSAAQRIIIKAKLAVAKSSKPTKVVSNLATPGRGKSRADRHVSLAEGLSGQTRSLIPSIVWGLATAGVGAAWWWAFRRWRHPITWLAGLVPFLVVLFPFYVYIERALPAGY
jgi:sortase A